MSKLSSIIDSMSGSGAGYSINKMIIYENRRFISKLNDKENLIKMAVSTYCDEDKIITFLRFVYDSLSFSSDKLFDDNSNSFLQNAVFSNKSLRFHEKLIAFTILKIAPKYFDQDKPTTIFKLLEHKNDSNKTYMDCLLDLSYFKVDKSEKDFISLLECIALISIDYIIDYYDKIIEFSKYNRMSDNFIEELRRICRKYILYSPKFKNSDVEDKKKILINLFGTVNYYDNDGNLLWCCLEDTIARKSLYEHMYNPFRIPDNYTYIELITDLLECGIDPNLLINGKTLVHNFILRDTVGVAVIKLLEVCLKYGYKINAENSLLTQCLDSWGTDERTLMVYKFLIANGFSSIDAIVDEKYILHHYPTSGLADYKDEIIYLYWCQCTLEYFSNVFNQRGLKVEKDFYNKFNNVINEFNTYRNKIQSFLDINEDYILRNIADIVIETRNNSVDISNEYITVSDIFDGLKYLLIKNQESFFENIEDVKQKIYNLETK